MRHKRSILIVTVIISVALLLSSFVMAAQSGWFFYDTYIEIENGFSAELLSILVARYQISIPDNAIFVKGINTNAIRDPSVVILFELPTEIHIASEMDSLNNYIFEKLNLDKSRYTFGGFDEEIYADWYEEMGGKLDYLIKDKHDSHTFLSYTLHKDKIIVRFVGRHPGATFS